MRRVFEFMTIPLGETKAAPPFQAAQLLGHLIDGWELGFRRSGAVAISVRILSHGYFPHFGVLCCVFRESTSACQIADQSGSFPTGRCAQLRSAGRQAFSAACFCPYSFSFHAASLTSIPKLLIPSE